MKKYNLSTTQNRVWRAMTRQLGVIVQDQIRDGVARPITSLTMANVHDRLRAALPWETCGAYLSPRKQNHEKPMPDNLSGK